MYSLIIESMMASSRLPHREIRRPPSIGNLQVQVRQLSRHFPL
jgi:hypothetical protein